jgi:HEPN domain-containing protein
MPDSRDWQRWVEYATEDFELAEEILLQRPRQASFHLQQSAEKYLKAALIAQGSNSNRTHDLVMLALELDAALTADDHIIAATQLLTLIGARSRYPDNYSELLPEEASALLEAARVIREFARQHLPK